MWETFFIFDPPFRITMEGGGWTESDCCVLCTFTMCQAQALIGTLHILALNLSLKLVNRKHYVVLGIRK